MIYIAYTLELQRTCTKLSPWQGNDGNPKSAKTEADGLDGCGSSWDGYYVTSGCLVQCILDGSLSLTFLSYVHALCDFGRGTRFLSRFEYVLWNRQ